MSLLKIVSGDLFLMMPMASPVNNETEAVRTQGTDSLRWVSPLCSELISGQFLMARWATRANEK